MQNEENTTTSEKPKAGRFLDECSLRDYFAAKAMGQLISHKERLMARADYSAVDAEWVVATAAYLQADAMLAARNRAGEEGR